MPPSFCSARVSRLRVLIMASMVGSWFGVGVCRGGCFPLPTMTCVFSAAGSFYGARGFCGKGCLCLPTLAYVISVAGSCCGAGGFYEGGCLRWLVFLQEGGESFWCR